MRGENEMPMAVERGVEIVYMIWVLPVAGDGHLLVKAGVVSAQSRPGSWFAFASKRLVTKQYRLLAY